MLVVDDEPATAMLLSSMKDAPFDAVVTADEWEALDVLASGVALVVCSVTMKTRGGAPFYRLLWNAHPELKRRFVFIASAAPASSASGRGTPVIERPVTRAVIGELVERAGAGG